MTERIALLPDKLPMFFKEKASNFCLLIPPSLKGLIEINQCQTYANFFVKILPPNVVLDEFVKHIEDDTDILFIPYQSPLVDCYPVDGNLKPNQRFVDVLANLQTPVTFQTLEHILNNIYYTSVQQLEHSTDIFFDMLSAADHLIFTNKTYGTTATLFFREDYLWSENIGLVLKGESIRAPYGEIALVSTLLRDDIIPCLEMEGEIVFDSTVILHLFAFEKSFLNEQHNMYHSLAKIDKNPVKIYVNNGTVEKVISLTQNDETALALEQFFSHDPQLRKIIEVGFGINKSIQLLPKNLAASEPYGGINNCLHLGFGSRKLNYHLDILCPQTTVFTNQGFLLAGV
ncbi:hypothetical protein [Legionella hackeliae]|uniref:Leucyl aminopeptidase (Aminopeptidase T) n=1 Tax=Legionella hackeliae TaxID=449 RepID=A0A0A8UPG0_LEGHA|nr:hypothetical protein [Legionella hackeliae]KTD06646.1 hypothetical protein Lhac_3169 [Legionella hackeliae]CEK10765.1 protein of unknown function [Legionella hackeliae]STX47503.1 Uncharacterised protein [Legionella hackeliae]